MKTCLEQEDIQQIAAAVFEMLKPLISGNSIPGEDIFDKNSLADYLKVSPGTINKMVTDRAIPFFKISEGKCEG